MPFRLCPFFSGRGPQLRFLPRPHPRPSAARLGRLARPATRFSASSVLPRPVSSHVGFVTPSASLPSPASDDLAFAPACTLPLHPPPTAARRPPLSSPSMRLQRPPPSSPKYPTHRSIFCFALTRPPPFSVRPLRPPPRRRLVLPPPHPLDGGARREPLRRRAGPDAPARPALLLDPLAGRARVAPARPPVRRVCAASAVVPARPLAHRARVAGLCRTGPAVLADVRAPCARVPSSLCSRLGSSSGRSPWPSPTPCPLRFPPHPPTLLSSNHRWTRPRFRV